MVIVSTTYDKDLKEQVFMIRGDERYARSTKTVIELGNRVETAEGFVQGIFVNVYRDVGTGSLVLYDNDVAIGTISDWTSTDTGRTIALPELTYESEHNLRVKYTGNGSCSPSMSNLLHTDPRENPQKIDAQLLIYTGYNRYDENGTVWAEAFFEDYPEEGYGKNISFYCDDELIDTVPIRWQEATAAVSFNIGSNGFPIKL